MSRGLAISIQTDSDHCPASSLTLTLVISDSFCLVLSSSNNGFQSQYVGPDLPSALGLVYKQKSPFTPAGANYFLWKSSWSREKHSQHWGPMCSWQCLLKGKLTINLDPIIQVFIEHYGRKTTPPSPSSYTKRAKISGIAIWSSSSEDFHGRRFRIRDIYSRKKLLAISLPLWGIVWSQGNCLWLHRGCAPTIMKPSGSVLRLTDQWKR